METLNFEAMKIAMKQDKEGYVLTLRVHPDEVPNELFRDFVGSRYQVVMVRLSETDQPMNREAEVGKEIVRLAGYLCRNADFAKWLEHLGEILDTKEDEVVEWMRNTLEVRSRAELSTNPVAAQRLRDINQEFQAWKQSA